MKEKTGRRPKFSKALFQRVLGRIEDLQMTVEAIQAEGMSKGGFYQALQREDHDGQMRKALDAAQLWRDQVINQAALEEAEAELVRRGVDGWQEPVYYKGEVVGTKPRYSDICLIALLRKLDPEGFRETTPIKNIVQVASQGTEDMEKLEADLADMVKGLQRRIMGPKTDPDQ